MHNIVIPVEYVLPKNIFFLYYPNNEKFTRIAEYKKFTHHKAANSLIGLEIPSANGRHYPLPQKKWHRLAKKYIDEFPEGMYSIGRNGSYFYSLDIDDCIFQAMLIKNEILKNTLSSGIVGEDYKFDGRI
jgi:UDP-galactopyranose mutase